MEDLGGIQILTSPTHRFGADALHLARFISLRAGDRVCDLGTGCGIIPLMLIQRGHTGPIDAVDIQEEAIDLLSRSIALGNIQNLRAFHADLRHLENLLPAARYDVVSCNPPYSPAGSGRLPAGDQKQIIRHETECTFEEICKATARLLRFSGRCFFCAPPTRLFEIMTTMRLFRLEPKRIRLVEHTRNASPYLLLIEGRLGGKPGLVVEPVLIQEVE